MRPGSVQRRENAAPCAQSFAQQRLWFLDQLEPGLSVYHIHQAFQLHGPLNVAALEWALNALVARHEALRTTFGSQDGTPVQIIHEAQRLPLPVLDLRDRPDADRACELEPLLSQHAHAPFDLERGPLLRALLVWLGEDRHALSLAIHHIVSDGWSMNVLYRELSWLYNAHVQGSAPGLKQLPVQYADYALWQRQRLQGEVLEQQLAYWRRQLAGLPPVLELPANRTRGARDFARGRADTLLDSELTDRLRALSRQEGATLFMTLLAAFQVLLYRYTAQEDLVVGVPIAGRMRPELEGLIGFFVNTLALRADLSSGPSFRTLLSRTRQAALGAYDHQELPFEKLVEVLHPQRSLSHSPLVQVMFALQNVPRSEFELHGVRAERLQVEGGQTKLDLFMALSEQAGGLKTSVSYRAGLFEREMVARLLGHWETLLRGIVADPDQSVWHLPLLPAGERRQLLTEWNDTHRPYAYACVHELVERQAERTPHAVALVFEGTTLSYRELNRWADHIAGQLRGRGVKPEVCVAVHMDRSLEAVAAVLAIWKAGGVYVPLDPEEPPQRLAFKLQDSAAAILLTQPQHVEKWADSAVEVLALNASPPEPGSDSTPLANGGATVDHLAYVLYTSGSTGKPKGVMVCHRSLCNYFLWRAHYFPGNAQDAHLQHTPCGFDVSLMEMFWPLTTGARLVIAKPAGHRDSAYLVRIMRDHGVVGVSFPPSMLQLLLDEPEFSQCHRLRYMIPGGEALPPELKERFFQRSSARLVNGYGPTETTIGVLFGECRPGRGEHDVPIGRPIANARIYLLDKALELVPIGVPGQLYVAGVGLARGYHRRPDLTAERFIPDPFASEPGARMYMTGDLARYLPDGNVEFLGRTDDQVQIRGMRVEPGEIEAALLEHPTVREAAVVAHQTPAAGLALVAYVAPSPGKTVELDEVRLSLRQRLPQHMVPSAFVVLDALPRLPNGKLDRRALPAPDSARLALDFAAPRSPMEMQIAEIWSGALGVDRIGLRDNFFDLGGHSLLAMQVVAKLEATLGVRVQPGDLMVQTLGQLAALCQGKRPQRAAKRVRGRASIAFSAFKAIVGNWRRKGE